MISITDLVHTVTGRHAKSTLQTSETSAEQLNRGSSHHAQIARHIQGQTIHDPTPEFMQYLQFRADHPELIFDPTMVERDVAFGPLFGRIDAFCRNAKGQGILVEWKRSKTDATRDAIKRMKSPMRHLDLNDVNSWGLQLGLQAVCVQNGMRIEVVGCLVVVCHPNRPTYQKIHVRDLRADAMTLIDYHVSRGRKRPAAPTSSSHSKRRRT